jgi:hypothetical protein
MNCLEFENVVVDLVRGAVMDSSLGTRCWAHAANCPRCAERLHEQEKLTAGLEALASRTDTKNMPERFEARLRSEFREHFTKIDGDAANPPNKQVRPTLHWMSPSRWAWIGAAAILLLTLAGLLALKTGTQLPAINTTQNVAVPKVAEPPKVIENKNESNHPAATEISTAQDSGANSPAKARKRRTGTKKSLTPERPTFRSAAQDELATNFYPLPYGSGLPLDDGWEIVRVSMPSSALAKFGVPVPGEPSSTTTIKADLVLGEDGLARAIRFVE